jgi:hypothetical protein
MPKIQIAKLKLRRGLDSQRKNVVLDQGELVSTTDTQRLFLGDGSTLGGISVTPKIHSPINNINLLTTINAQIGDIVNVDSIFYQLTGSNFSNLSSWSNIGTRLNPVYFSYNNQNQITINANSIPMSSINPLSISDGLKIESGLLKIDFNTTNFSILSSKFTIKPSGITENEIATSSFGNGISGGNGSKINLSVDPNVFYFESNVLKINQLQLSSIDPSSIGDGLVVDNTTNTLQLDYNIFKDGFIRDSEGPNLSAYIADVDRFSIVRNNEGIISLPSISELSGIQPFANLTIDEFGKIISRRSSIVDVLTGNSSLGGHSPIYDGDSLGITNIIPTIFTAISSNGQTVNLSSAGFITFEDQTTNNGSSARRFAIPIYRY